MPGGGVLAWKLRVAELMPTVSLGLVWCQSWSCERGRRVHIVQCWNVLIIGRAHEFILVPQVQRGDICNRPMVSQLWGLPQVRQW
jgi:hypothetical protein